MCEFIFTGKKFIKTSNSESLLEIVDTPLEIFELINNFCRMEDFIETNDGFIQITCHFCFEPFEVQLDVSSENFLKNSEIIDCTICCNPNRIDYEVDESGISTLSITDGND